MDKLQALYIRGAWVLLGLKPQAGNNNDITTATVSKYQKEHCEYGVSINHFTIIQHRKA